jgi:hypothetical protein
MSIWTDGLPAWWAMAVAVAALLAGVLLGWRWGRSVGYLQAKEDRKADAAVRQVRSWRGTPSAPEVRYEAADVILTVYCPKCGAQAHQLCTPPMGRLVHMERAENWKVKSAEVAHEAWLAHTELAMDLANDDPTVSAWTQQMAESMDAFLAGLLAEHPVPYLPGEEER